MIVTANDYQLGVLNGTRAEVTGVDPRHQTVTLATDDQQNLAVPADWAGRHLDHGYAMTCHKAQGATVDTAWLYGTGALSREAGYVALSRGRTSNHLYVPDMNDNDISRTKISDESHLDWLAARLTSATPRHRPAVSCRDSATADGSSRAQDLNHSRSEGISR